MAYLGKSPTEIFRSFSVKDTFTGDGSTLVFTLSRAAFVGSPNDVQVFVDNVRQEPGSGKAFTIELDGSSNATQLTFTAAPPAASEIYVIISAEPTTVVVPADNSVSTAKVQDGAITSAKIADGTVIAADVGDGTITGAKLASDIAISTTGTVTATSFSGDGASLTALNVSTDSTPQLGGDLDLNSNDITGTGNINITGTIESSGNITGTLATASQPNITSVGTLTSFTSTGIDDNATSTAITIDSSQNVNLIDNSKIRLGTGNDLEIYHDGTDSHIKDSGSGALILDSNGTDVRITKNDTEFMAKFNIDSHVGLYYDNSEKFQTTSTGALILGRLATSGGNASEPNFNFSLDGNTGIFRASQDVIAFSNNGSETMRIDSSGNLLVGKTAIALATVGGELRENGQITGTRDGNASLILNRLTSDGDIAKFYKDGTVIGSISVGSSNNLQIFSTATDHCGLNFGTNQIVPMSNGSSSDNTVDIGNGSNFIKDIHVKGGILFGSTSSDNKLDDYEEGTWTPNIQAGGNHFTSVTHDIQNGYYTKVGRLVIAHFRVKISAVTIGSATGNIQVESLPFSVANVDSTNHASYVSYVSDVNFNLSSFSPISIGLNAFYNQNKGGITRSKNSGTADGVPIAAIGQSTDIVGTFIYFVD